MESNRNQSRYHNDRRSYRSDDDWRDRSFEGQDMNRYNRVSYRHGSDDRRSGYSNIDNRYGYQNSGYNDNYGSGFNAAYSGTAYGHEQSRQPLNQQYKQSNAGHQDGRSSDASAGRYDPVFHHDINWRPYPGRASNHLVSRQRDYDQDRSWWDRARDELASWFGDDNAERRRRTDHPAEGMHRGKGPKGYQRSADRIREDVCERLSEDGMLDATNISVQVQGDEVILSGTVNNRLEKRRAEDLVERIAGVHHVENRIRVAYNDTSPWSGSSAFDPIR